MDITAAVRLRINDKWRYQSEDLLGNGYDATYKLAQGQPYSTITAASATIRLASSYSATGATFDATLGLVSFSGVISANSAFRAVYQWAVFSDAEVTQFISDGGGSVAGASLEAVRGLMFDHLKRARWSAPDGTQYDDTQASRLLEKMYAMLKAEVDEVPAGGIEAWSEQQQYYDSAEYSA